MHSPWHAKAPTSSVSDICAGGLTWELADDAWRAQAHAPNACPADVQKVDIGQTEFLRMIRAVPPAERATTSVAQAIIPPLNRRFPCR